MNAAGIQIGMIGGCRCGTGACGLLRGGGGCGLERGPKSTKPSALGRLIFLRSTGGGRQR